MLVLSRRMDEQIVIGDDIRVTVLKINGNKVKLGIQAGEDFRIMRAELLNTTPQTAEDHPAEPSSRIADPTTGMADEELTEDGQSHLAGPSDTPPAPAWANTHPAWLAICCCS